MEIKTSYRAYTGLVEKYVGSAYDMVKVVGDNIASVITNANWLNNTEFVPQYRHEHLTTGNEFFAGTDNQITLAYPTSTKEDIDVYFDGLYQGKNSFNLVDNNIVVFTATIPVEVLVIDVKYRYI